MIADVLHHCRGRKTMRLYSRASSERVRKAVPLMWLLIGLTLAVFSSSQVLAQVAGDNFNDNSMDTDKWGPDEEDGNAVLTEINERLEYTTEGSSADHDSVDRMWKPTRFPYSANWEIQIDVTNTTSSSTFSSFGIDIRSVRLPDNDIEVELGQDGLFWAEFSGGKQISGEGYAAAFDDDTYGAVRIEFDSGDKIFNVYYDSDPTNDYQWTWFGSFGVAGTGGTHGTRNWGLTDTDQFIAYVFGYSEKMSVTSGQLYGDKFLVTGGVELPRPEITNPDELASFNTCSYFDPPLFEWSPSIDFQKLELQFYTDANRAKPTKVKVKDPTATQLLMPSNTWKKILALPGLSGGVVNWKIVGTIKGQPAVESREYTMTIDPPEFEHVVPQINPTNQTQLPTLTWENKCATKFKVYFSPEPTFSRKKTLSFTDKDPLDNGETFSTTLVGGTWNAIRKLVNDEVPSTIWWYVESWDALKRYQRTGDMQFTLVGGP